MAEAAFDTVNTTEVLAGVKHKEQLFKTKLNEINDQFQVFSEIRGKGLLLGAALNEQYKGRARDFLLAALEQGTMCLIAGANVIRFAPSLVIPDEDIEEGLNRFAAGIAEIVKG